MMTLTQPTGSNGAGGGLGGGGAYKFYDSLETAASKSTPGAPYKRINSELSFSSL